VQSISYWRVILAITVTLLAVIFAAPNFIEVKSSFLPKESVNLGLDLRGGSHLLLDVDLEHYIKDQYELLADNLRKELRDHKIGYRNLRFLSNQVQLELRDVKDLEILRGAVRSVDRGVWVDPNDSKVILRFKNDRLAEMESNVIDQSIEIVRMRVDSTGTKEPIIQRQGDKQILLQVPGADNPGELQKMLGKTAKLTFHLVNDDANIEEAVKGHVPNDSLLLAGETSSGQTYPIVIRKKSFLSGDLLSDAKATFNQHAQPGVSISFNNIGGKIFGEITKTSIGRRIAIVLDGKVLSAASINEPILGGNAIISGNFTVESANELALLLRAGALPAPLKTIEERTIGPNLGADSIESGKKAGLFGFTLVIIFMIWSYGILGIFANIALSLALLYILAMLSVFQATLTLPGIAAIILTIGMAVDANILIYERIKEEITKGASNLFAIKQGFEAASGTIFDSNITTLIVAFILYIYGAGAVKGFAVSLTIGIIASMFTAITITKLFIDLWMKFCKPQKLGLE
jgi:preprotein translocase subunit SecD